MDDSLSAGEQAKDDPEDEEDLEPLDDEFDPFADRPVDPPPKEGEEGDDRVHKDS